MEEEKECNNTSLLQLIIKLGGAARQHCAACATVCTLASLSFSVTLKTGCVQLKW